MIPSDDGTPTEFPHFDAPPSPTKTSDNLSGMAHRRSASGNSLFSKLPFLRTAAVVDPLYHSSADSPAGRSTSPNRKTASSASAAKKPRSRKGSLRKTALLGTGRIRLDRRVLGLETIASPRLEQAAGPTLGELSPPSAESDDYPTPRASYDASGRDRDEEEDAALGCKSSAHMAPQHPTSSDEHLVLKPRSRPGPRREVSTTDEEDALDVLRGTTATPGPALNQLPEDPGSYFSALKAPSLRTRASKSSVAAKSPLGTMPMEQPASSEEWDYAATEWWGWVILVLTWVVFVVGMGSCFGVWSWAWDVGETPYAPPELEDDPTLPIVGYYPALIMLTGVMAWVWVIIAWVGMKYFKHAKISGEDV